MKFRHFFGKSLVLLLACCGIAILISRRSSSPEMPLSLFTGIGMAYLNALLGFAILYWGFRRSERDFLISVYGGMIFRFLLIFAVLFVLIGAPEVDIVALTAALMVTYFLFLGLEIWQIYQLAETKRTS